MTPDFLTGPRKPTDTNLNLGTSFQVSLYSGAFTYYYPIQTPPGTNGLKPNVGLYYVSHNKVTQSILGSAWTLSQNYIERDVNYTFSNTSDDKFKLVLDGQSNDLVYVQSENRFHTKIESFMYIENKTSTNNTNGQYFTVKTKDGTSYRFGYNFDSELVSNLSNYTVKWSLDLVNDTNGNQIFYGYKENPYPSDMDAVYLDNIKYNNDKNRTIDFLYETSNRPDLWYIYGQGSKTQQSRRLKEIIVKAQNNLVNRYVLNYTSDNLTIKNTIGSIVMFGSDNLTSLSKTTFDYIKNTQGWANDVTWKAPLNNSGSPLVFSSKYGTPSGGSIFDYGIRFVDVNGDGLVDILKGFREGGLGNYIYETYINNGSTWVNSSLWRPPVIFVSQGDGIPDFGVRFGDVNGDGLIDIIRGFVYINGTNAYSVYINNGSGGWIDNSTWKPPVIFASQSQTETPDFGVRVEDVNGDGLIDIIQAYQDSSGNYIYETYVNNGASWVNGTAWRSPVIFASKTGAPTGVPDYGVRFADVNGDGLVDILKGFAEPITNYHIYDVYINNGSGWVNSSTWRLPIIFVSQGGGVPDYGFRFADVNGDGLVDIMQGNQNNSGTYNDIFINNGIGWVNTPTWKSPVIFNSDVGGVVIPDYGVRFGDVNGDGLIDIVKSYEELNQTKIFSVYINNISNSYLLNNITNSYGGKIDINYGKSTSLNNTGNDTLSDLGFNLWVVLNITQDNGVNGSGGVLSNTNYFYQGGLYNFKEKEFRGFSYVSENKTNQTIKHYFHQDSSRSGLEYIKQIFDNKDNPYEKIESIWNFTIQNGYYINKLITQTSYTYDGAINNPKVKNITYSYDDFGNIIVINNLGDISKQGDEKYQYYDYLNNSNSWIIDKPKHYSLFASDNTTKLRESFFTYDNLNYNTPPTKGKLTSKEDYLNIGGQNTVTNYSYDSFGNLIELMDPNGNLIKYIYGIRDLTFTFADQVKNAKNQTNNLNYDLGTGNLLWETDSNGFARNYTYDVFGRRLKEIQPYDSLAYPTKEYQYDFDGIAPEKIKIMQREINGTNNTFDTYSFYDGFGRLIQNKKESDNNQQIVTDTYFDENSRISAVGNPYFVSFYENYSQPYQNVKRTNYTYDPLDRVVLIINPDNTKKIFSYNHFTISSFDENNNKKDYYLDSYGRIINVIEFNKGQTYNTSYRYDASDNLIQIKDSQNITFNFTYDTLGRKIKIQDPDLGTWNYTYDSVGNLIKQIDNRNISIGIGYDQLNRIIYKNSSTQNISYTYDLILNETLSKIQANNYTINYNYDNRLRKIYQTNTIDGIPFNISYTYDSMDRIAFKLLPDGKNITHTYNNQSNLETVSDIITNIDYNEINKPIIRVYINSLSTNYTYNTTNFRLTRIKTDVLQDLNYIYDNSTNIVTINDTATQDIYSISYDDLDRLTYAQKYNLTNQVFIFRENYTYSSIGNMLSMNSDTKNLTYFYKNTPVHAPISIFSTSSDITLNKTNRFIIQNASGTNVAWLSNRGDIVLKGTCTVSSNCIPPANSFALRNTTGDVVSYLDNTGNLCIESGDCTDKSPTCSASANSFIVKDYNNTAVLYINSTGDLCLTGRLYENIQDVNNPEINNYTLIHDPNGNLIQGFGKYYEYDDFNQLKKVRQNNASGTLLEEYFYDHEGKRIKKAEHLINTTTYYIDENFIQIRNSSGTYNETYYYAEDVLVAKKDNNGVITFYHPDHLGSTNLVTNSTGGVVEITNYNPYGELLEGGKSRYLFTGKELDRGTNFEYYGARYYYPYIRIFIVPDQNIQNVYNSQDLNRYMYVRGNPYKNIDPTGKYSCDALYGCYAADYGFFTVTFGNMIYDENEGVDYRNQEITAIPLILAGAVTGIGEAGLFSKSSTTKLSKVESSLMKEDVQKGLSNEIKNPNIQTPELKGAANPVVKEAIEVGKQQHREFYNNMNKQGYTTNKAIPGTNLRPDAFNPNTRIIIELKPETKAAINRGWQQVSEYEKAAQNYFGGKWKSFVQTYKTKK